MHGSFGSREVVGGIDKHFLGVDKNRCGCEYIRMQNLKNYAIVGILVVGSFVMGQFYTKTTYLEKQLQEVKGTNVAAAPIAPAGNVPPAPQAPVELKYKVTDADPIKGDPKAKVTIVEYSDFQCPFCGRFYKNVLPSIVKDYIDTGKVKFVYKSLAFLGKESDDTANAAFCAREQNKFWEFHNYIFEHQNGENQGTFSIDNLKKFGAELGLNTTQYNSCIDTNKYSAQVKEEIAEANANGFNSTPSFAIGTQALVGAQPYEQFKTAIDAELAKVK